MDLGDKFSIETPEQIPLEFPLAGIGSRFLAMLYDSLLQLVGAAVLIITFLLLAGDLGRYWPAAWNWTAAFYVFVGFFLYWGYFAFFESLWKGQTPGKRHAGIRVIKDSGRAITAFEAIARNLLRAIDSLPAFYGVGCICIFLDRKNRRLGDLVAGTVVVHEGKDEAARPLWSSAAAGEMAVAGSDIVARLTVQELTLIETFLSRRLDLAPEVRRRTARQIAERIGERLNVSAAARPGDEDFLESVARQFRDAAHFMP